MGRKGKKKSEGGDPPKETSINPAAGDTMPVRAPAPPAIREEQNFPPLGGNPRGRGDGPRGGGGGRGGGGDRGGFREGGGRGNREGDGGRGGRRGEGGREFREGGGNREGDGGQGRRGEEGGRREGGGFREGEGGRGGGRREGGGFREGGRGGEGYREGEGGRGGREGGGGGGRGGGGSREGDGGRGRRDGGGRGGRDGGGREGSGGRGRGRGERRDDREFRERQPEMERRQEQRPGGAWGQPQQQQQSPSTSDQQQKSLPQSPPQTPSKQDPKPPTKEMEKLSLKEKPSSKQVASKVKVDYKSSVSETISKQMISSIPLRKGEGKLGRPIQVFVNMMKILFGKNFRSDVIHYDATFDPDVPRYLIPRAFEKFRLQYFPKRWPAFDGRKNVFSAGLLPFGETTEQEVEVPNDDGRMKKFKITLNKVNDIDIGWLKHVKKGLPETERDLISIQALDIILRQAPLKALNVTAVGRSFFTPPSGHVAYLGDGVELWVGLFQSAVLGWKPLLNVDVAHKGFPKSQKVLDLMAELCRTNDYPTRRDVDYNREEIEKFLKRLKVKCEIPGQAETKRTYTINKLVKCPRDNYFEHQNKQISVEHYYLIEKKYKIQYPELPCLHVGPIQKNIHVPPELCTILPGQATNKKMNEQQTSNMIRHAATGTDIRRQKIMDSFNKIRHNQNPCLNEFGLSISGEFEKVKARVLDPPVLTYNRDVHVSRGVWRASNFLDPKSLLDNEWTILCLDNRTREDSLRNLEQNLRREAGNLGMSIGCARTPYGQLQAPTRSLQDVIRFFNDAKRNKLKLVFVVVPDRPPNIYSKVKQVAELNVGVLTQCLKSQTVFKKLNPATMGNILLKVNAKLDGINHTFSVKANCRPNCLSEPCMIVGADVTHPSPDAIGIPSIAAVAASHDPKAFKYNIVVRLQPPRAEIIQNLEEIMGIQLRTFYEKTKQKPKKIIFYRDGVSEGQFPQVMYYELKAIRNACKRLSADYEPKISFFVVQKRHHIRLFPTDKCNSDDRNFNVQAGTIVDTDITHPSHIDFYLVSHASIQGTARPTKYRCLWDDSDMSEDEIEQLTYYLCHMFTRCTRSVSYPTPTYYAHLAAFRARALTQDVQIDVNNLEQEQKTKLTIKEDFKNNPMFFV
ncbi:protein argonaute-2-like isoform X2 [Leptopilina boulardi]|uniref:protein argonaute-2-like isoform X2 n=1 Tax=Leptopilina boulardi TaxID=63433 RepID=UPI0021F510B6|nr:protein argonaute-2-like isoform X2 [Leptopilina boulardi]